MEQFKISLIIFILVYSCSQGLYWSGSSCRKFPISNRLSLELFLFNKEPCTYGSTNGASCNAACGCQNGLSCNGGQCRLVKKNIYSII